MSEPPRRAAALALRPVRTVHQIIGSIGEVDVNMQYTDEQLTRIYDRTSGKCHLCTKKLAFTNYGIIGAKAAWEVEHSRPRAKGGSSRVGNLYAACIGCNRSKGTIDTRTARHRNGRERAPLSRVKRKQAKIGNAVAWGSLGTLVGAALGGKKAALLGGVLGAGMGYRRDPDED